LPKPNASEETIEERARQLLKRAMAPSKTGHRQGDVTYQAFRTVDDLSGIAYTFYKAVGW
jgi:hypothetical protein